MSSYEERVPRYRVITNIEGKPGEFWAACTEYCQTPQIPAWFQKILYRRLVSMLTSVLTAVRLMRRRRGADALITTSSTGTLLFACLQSIFSRGQKPHVMIDCLWYRSSNCFKHVVFSWFLRFAAGSVKKFVVWERHETKGYAQAFGVSPDKFEYVHFWHTLGSYTFDIQDHGYIFTDGNWNRDYEVVLQAARTMPDVPFFIGVTYQEPFDGLEIPSNVTIDSYTDEEFRQAMAGCSIMVVPMLDGLLHTDGQQTLLNAMFMGKPVVAVGRPWSSDIITDGEDGLIVDFYDERKFQYGLKWLWANPDSRQQIGEKAGVTARSWSPERGLAKIYRLTLDLYAVEPVFFDRENEVSDQNFLRAEELHTILNAIEDDFGDQNAIVIDEDITTTIEKFRQPFSDGIAKFEAVDDSFEESLQEELQASIEEQNIIGQVRSMFPRSKPEDGPSVPQEPSELEETAY